jgi:hypothetical protein
VVSAALALSRRLDAVCDGGVADACRRVVGLDAAGDSSVAVAGGCVVGLDAAGDSGVAVSRGRVVVVTVVATCRFAVIRRLGVVNRVGEIVEHVIVERRVQQVVAVRLGILSDDGRASGRDFRRCFGPEHCLVQVCRVLCVVELGVVVVAYFSKPKNFALVQL